MKTETSKTSNIIEAVVLFVVSVPLLIIGLFMGFISIRFMLNIIRYGINMYDLLSCIFAISFTLLGVFDTIALIHMLQSFLTERRPILSYQHRIKSYIQIRKVLICTIIVDLIYSLEFVFNETEAAAIIFVVVILPITLLARWRFNVHKNTLKELILEDLKTKKNKIMSR